MSSPVRPLSLTWDLLTLGVEAGEVVFPRSLAFLGGGPGALAKARQMIGEKVVLGLELQRRARTGEMVADPADTTRAVVRHIRQKVFANRRRLRG